MDPAAKSPPDDSSTGLPWLRTWTAVYTLVLVVFALTIVALTALTLAYR